MYLAVVALFAYAVWDAAQPVARVQAIAAVSRGEGATPSERTNIDLLPQDLPGAVVCANEPVEIRSTVDGTIAAVMVKEGDTVQKGQPLLRFDDSAWQNALAWCELARWIAEGRINSGEPNRVSVDAVPAIRTSPDGVSSGLMTLLRSLCAQGHITTPVDGIVGKISVTPGSCIQASGISGLPDAPPLIVVYPSDKLAVQTTVTPQEAWRVGMGRSVLISVESMPGEIFEGVVVSMRGSLDQSGGHCDLRIALADAPSSLQPGMNVHVSFRETDADRERRSAVLVPRDALISHDRETAAFWVIGVDNLLQKREAVRRPAWDAAEHIAVLGGVRPGEPVVVTPDASLREGQRVTTE